MALPEVCQQCGKLAFPGSTVTIATDEYEELLRFRGERQTDYARLSSFRLASRSKIARDPELAQYILQCAETMLIGQIEAACVTKFGRERTPSRSSIHRFVYRPGQIAGK